MKRRDIVLGLPLLIRSSLVAAQARQPLPKQERARDPVCGIMAEKNPELSAQYKGRIYYFCSKADRDEFKKNPGKYVK
jgi:YHS domain-containing protein